MKEKNQNIKQKNKKGIKLNKKVIAIGTTAILALATIVVVYMFLHKKIMNGISIGGIKG